MKNTVPYAGILATGSRAGVWYLQKFQAYTRSVYGADYVAPIHHLSVPFQQINTLLPGQMKEAGEKMLPYYHDLDRLQVSHFILANITLHEAFDCWREQIPGASRIIHIREILADLSMQAEKTIMFIGTSYSMDNRYLPSLLPPAVSTIQADIHTREELDALRKIYYHGENRAVARRTWQKLLENYPDTDHFVISCTEHALALEGFARQDRFWNLPLLQCRYLAERMKEAL